MRLKYYHPKFCITFHLTDIIPWDRKNLESDDLQFSVIIPAFNRGAMLMECLDSILVQRHVMLEVIVVDDGSTDETPALMRGVSDARVRYHRQENRERGGARNAGLKFARGSYINYFDSDDLFHPCLHELWNFISMNRKPPVVYGSLEMASEDGRSLGRAKTLNAGFRRNILHNNFLACGSVFLRRDVALENLFSEDRRLSGAEDWELWLRIYSEHDFKEAQLTIFKQRQHPLRSLNSSMTERAVAREKAFADHVNRHKNALLNRFTGSELDAFIADRWTFMALTEFEAGNKRIAFRCLLRSFSTSKRVVWRRRFWAVMKKLVVSWD